MDMSGDRSRLRPRIHRRSSRSPAPPVHLAVGLVQVSHAPPPGKLPPCRLSSAPPRATGKYMSHGSRRDRPPSSATSPERRHALAAGAPSAHLTGSVSPCQYPRQVPQPWAHGPRSRCLPLRPVPR